jgi:diguanylate cyclase (GGDEF)-like protein
MNQDLLETVLACPSLPSLPAVAVRVLELTQDPDVKLTEIAAAIQNDQALASKILRTVNSSYYGLRKGCSTISHALVLLGLNPVKTLALGFSLVGTLKHGIQDPFDHVRYWRRGLYTAVGAKGLATAARFAEPEEAFLAGLMQDVGMIALYNALGEDYLKILQSAGPDHRRLAAAETDALELNHAEVGAALCKRWKLPQTLVKPIRFHERPAQAPPDVADVVRYVNVGGLIHEALTEPEPTPSLERVFKRCEEWLSFTADRTEEILAQCAEGTRELSRLFEIDTGPYPDADTILDKANQTLINITLHATQEATTLSEQNRELREKIDHDALTGAANRARFNREIQEAYEQVERGGKLALVFIDADHFKRVNDTHGHLAGDAVLVELSRRLIEHFGDNALVCRYGGEEFAVVLPGADRVEAARLAETVRVAVASEPFDLSVVPDSPPTLDVTVSVGVAAITFNELERFADYTQFVNAADRAVYAAKKSGRNCVRVFKAKTRAAA